MTKIIPYYESLDKGNGAFIEAKGNIIPVDNDHEDFSKKYCCNNNSNTLINANIYSSSNLSKEQLKLYKLWIEKFEFERKNLFSDFMVYILGFDKVETIIKKTITTACQYPHIRFYNYYLMDWDIECHTAIKFNEETGLFEYDKKYEYLISSSEDRYYKNEIEDIKTSVLKKDRPYFFK